MRLDRAPRRRAAALRTTAPTRLFVKSALREGTTIPFGARPRRIAASNSSGPCMGRRSSISLKRRLVRTWGKTPAYEAHARPEDARSSSRGRRTEERGRTTQSRGLPSQFRQGVQRMQERRACPLRGVIIKDFENIRRFPARRSSKTVSTTASCGAPRRLSPASRANITLRVHVGAVLAVLQLRYPSRRSKCLHPQRAWR